MSVSGSMPQLGESVTEGTVTRWLKKEGERVEVDEPLLEVSTDKVDTEIPSPASGICGPSRSTRTKRSRWAPSSPSSRTARPAASAPGRSTRPRSRDAAAPQPRRCRLSSCRPVPRPHAARTAGGPQPELCPAARGPAILVAFPARGPVAVQRLRSARRAYAHPNPADAAYGRPRRRLSRGRPGAAPTQPAASSPPGRAGGGATRRRRRCRVGEAPYVTPLVRKLAAEHAVNLESVTGTGVGGRIRKQDVIEAARAQRGAQPRTRRPRAPARRRAQPPAPRPSRPSRPRCQQPQGRTAGGPSAAAARPRRSCPPLAPPCPPGRPCCRPRCAARPSACPGPARSSRSGWSSRCTCLRSSPRWSRPT